MAEQLGARKDGAYKAVCTAPSINKTPVGSSVQPLPYPVSQDLANSVAVVPTVRFNVQPAYVLSQTTQPSCVGDAAGSVGGTKSGQVSGEVKPTAASSTVRLTGKQAVRMNDPCTLNKGNCPGKYVKAPPPNADASAATPTGAAPVQAQAKPAPEQSLWDRAVDAAKGAAQQYQDKYSSTLHEVAGSAMDKGGTAMVAGATTAEVGGLLSLTGPGAAVGVPMVAAGGVATAAGGVVTALGAATETAASALDAASHAVLTGDISKVVATATTYAKNMVTNVVSNKVMGLASKLPGANRLLGGPDNKPKAKPNDAGGTGKDAGAGKGDGLKVAGSGGGPCKVGPYSQLEKQCPPGQQAHHIVPDTLNRFGNRVQGKAGLFRIKGLPSFDSGASICLTGQARVVATEHYVAHSADALIKARALRTDNGPQGTLPVKEAVPIAVDSAAAARPDCRKQIEEAIRKDYPNYENDNRSMNGAFEPATGEARGHLENGGRADDTSSTRDRPSRRP